MKARVLLALVLAGTGLATLAAAGSSTVNLAWDPSPSSGVTNYVLLAHTNVLNEATRNAAVVRVSVGTNLTATLERLAPGRWWFAAYAVAAGDVSDLSNVLQYEVLSPPANLRSVLVTVQYTASITNTNGWQDVGFFRLKLP